MKLVFSLLILFLPQCIFAESEVKTARVLEPVTDANIVQDMVVDDSLLESKQQLLDRIVKTLYYLQTDEAKETYETYFSGSVSIESVQESLHRFYLILLLSPDLETFSERVKNAFALFRSIGQDGRGKVRFTGYFQPVYEGSRHQTAEYRYPLFTKPGDFENWPDPHPSRVSLEGFDGRGGEGTLLREHELVWLKNRFDVFMVHVQGSAIIELPDGATMSVGFAAGTNHPFTGISREFLQKYNVAWHRLGHFFQNQPGLLDQVMSRNNRFIFFEEKPDPDAVGSLGVPVLAERSIATDRLKLPPGAVALIRTKIPEKNKSGRIVLKEGTRFVLNLDTGSAIKGPGRVDLFMGTGEEARMKASSVYATGELYYLFLNTQQPRTSATQGS